MAASVDDKLARAAVREPFRRQGADYFADGITDDLTTDLSHLDGSFVIARNTAFTYKRKQIEPRQALNIYSIRWITKNADSGTQPMSISP
jgi:TolB-like protein